MVVVTNVVLLLSVVAFIGKVYVATSPRVGKAVDKMITWGATSLKLGKSPASPEVDQC